MTKVTKVVSLGLIICLPVFIFSTWFLPRYISEYKFREFLSSLEKGEFEKASDYLHYYGEKHSKYRFNPDLPVITAKEEKKLWISGMKRLKEEGIEIISHKEMRVNTDDSFTSGSVILIIKHQEKTYDVRLFAHLNDGRFSPGMVSGIGSYPHPDPKVQYIVDQINKIMPTTDPG